MITQTKAIPGLKLHQSESGVPLPIGKPVVIGPGDCVAVILPFRVKGIGVVGLLPRCQIQNLMISASMSEKGIIRVQLWNAGRIAKFISRKTCVVTLKYLGKLKFEMEKAHALREVDRFGNEERWKDCFPSLFDIDRPYAETPQLKEQMISQNEIEWKIPFLMIPRSSRGVEYEAGEVSVSEAENYLNELVEKKVIRSLRMNENAHMSPALFLRKPKGGIRKVVDFRILNSYSFPWVGPMEVGGLLGILRSIPQSWKIFSVLDLQSAFANIPVSSNLQELFGFLIRIKDTLTSHCLKVGVHHHLYFTIGW